MWVGEVLKWEGVLLNAVGCFLQPHHADQPSSTSRLPLAINTVYHPSSSSFFCDKVYLSASKTLFGRYGTASKRQFSIDGLLLPRLSHNDAEEDGESTVLQAISVQRFRT